jgi:hypothetical protein
MINTVAQPFMILAARLYERNEALEKELMRSG